jgi:tripartite-type tricarboxylate transporter receptor subunit TctC
MKKTLFASLVLALGILPGASIAQAYPTRPITVIVPFTPGASTDALSRAAARELEGLLGQPVVVANQPGAGTTIATRAALRNDADGYTILMQSSGFMTSLYDYANPGYKMSDFSVMGALGYTPFIMLVQNNDKIKSLENFVDYLRKNTGKLNVATLGLGGAHVLLSEAFQKEAGFKWTNVPYKGGAPAMNALLAGDVQSYSATVSFATGQKSQDRLRPLAVTSKTRSEFFPDVPTFAEKGYPGVYAVADYGFLVRSDTPEAIKKTLRDAMAKVMSSPAMKETLKKLGTERFDGDANAYQKQIESFATSYARDAKALKMPVN